MVVVTTTEFNTKQKKYFDLAKREKVAIKRGKNRYFLTFDKDLEDGEDSFNDGWAVTPEMIAEYDRIRQDMLSGNCIRFETAEDAISYFQLL
jgi:hypothetical protein